MDNDVRELRKVMGTESSDPDSVETKIWYGCEGIEVELIDWPHNPYRAIFDMVTATWGDEDYKEKWDDISPNNRFEVVKTALNHKTLPTALETPKFTFLIRGASRAAFDQIARVRVGAGIGSMGVRDNNRSDSGFRMPYSLKDSDLHDEIVEHVLKTKDLYSKIIKQGQKSWQSARCILPMNMTHHFYMTINYLALQGQCTRRLRFCLQKGTKVRTKEGIKNIEDIDAGEEVLTHLGRYRKVMKTFKNQTDEDIHTITSFGINNMPLTLTANHPILCVKKENKGESRAGTSIYKNDQTSEWIDAKDIKKGDLIVLPIDNNIEDIDEIDISAYYREPYFKNRDKQEKIDQIKINEELLTLIGYYLAEGNCGISTSGPTNVNLTFGKNVKEKAYAEYSIKCYSKVFATTAKYSRFYNEYGHRVRLINRQLASFMVDNFGNHSSQKRIPFWIKNLPVEKLKILLLAYIQGDGWFSYSTDISRANTVSISLNLSSDVRDICLKCGYNVTMRKHDAEENPVIMGRFVNSNDKYSLGFYCLEKKSKDAVKGYRYWNKGDYFYSTVSENSNHMKTNEYVYNLEVEEDNSYVTLHGAVHNCEMEDTVAVFWLIRNEVGKLFPTLAHYLRPGCDFSGKCQYMSAYTLSNAFGCLFKPCGRHPYPEDLSHYEFNESCTSLEQLEKDLGLLLPKDNFKELTMWDNKESKYWL